MDSEVGAGTFHPACFLRAIGPEPWNTAYVQPSRRPTDGRYGENPNRAQHYYQFQVLLKPSPPNIQELYLNSLRSLGIDPLLHDIRFVEDNWESPTLGAWGLGWEVWQNGMEITQFTYFQQVGGLECRPVTGEITYGLEASRCFYKASIICMTWFGQRHHTATSLMAMCFLQNEKEQSAYNFEHANIEALSQNFEQYEQTANTLVENNLPMPAYEQILKASHTFNLLDARGALSVPERQHMILRIRKLAFAVAKNYYDAREALGFPGVKEAANGHA